MLPRDDFERERLASFLTTDLYNLNVEWIRSLYVSVSMNEAIRINGRRIVIGRKHQTKDDAILYAIGQLSRADARLRWIDERSRFFEPSWSSVNTLPRLATILNFPEKNKINTSIAAARDAINSLRVARNYYAHRNMDSRKAFFGEMDNLFGWTELESPSIAILNRNVGVFPSAFLFWLNDCERVNREVCEL